MNPIQLPPKGEKPVPAKPRAIVWFDETPAYDAKLEKEKAIAAEEDAMSGSQEKPPSAVAAEALADKANKEPKKKVLTLVTNASKDDLVHRLPADIKPIMNHKQEKTDLKPSLKPFKIDNNKLTGLKNFTQICKDPLALPHYALPVGEDAANRGKHAADIKAKRPDDKRKSEKNKV